MNPPQDDAIYSIGAVARMLDIHTSIVGGALFRHRTLAESWLSAPLFTGTGRAAAVHKVANGGRRKCCRRPQAARPGYFGGPDPRRRDRSGRRAAPVGVARRAGCLSRRPWR